MNCPHCGRPINEQQPVTAADLARDCKARGLAVLPGARVSESVAAEVLGLSAATLRTWRSRHGGGQLPYVRTGGSKGRVSYRLDDLCAFFDYCGD